MDPVGSRAASAAWRAPALLLVAAMGCSLALHALLPLALARRGLLSLASVPEPPRPPAPGGGATGATRGGSAGSMPRTEVAHCSSASGLQIAGLRNLSGGNYDSSSPILVDVVMHPQGAEAYIIFNLMHCQHLQPVGRMLEASGECQQLWKARWQCGWSGAPWLDGTVRWNPRGDREGRGGAMVVTCPANGSSSDSLSLAATQGNRSLYSRSNINVCKHELVGEQLHLAACTMVINDAQVTPYIYPWVEHQLLLGVERILVYVEEQDDSFVRERLRRFLAAGQVTLINFWFPGVSSLRKFHTQSSQILHCLHWAKGRARWMASMDIDEYFLPLGSFRTLPDVLAAVSRDRVSAVQARGSFWAFGSRAALAEARGRADFPCQVLCSFCNRQCGKDGLGIPNSRSKIIMNTETTFYNGIHRVWVGSQPVHVANASSELRLVHVKIPLAARGCPAEPNTAFRDSSVCRARGAR